MSLSTMMGSVGNRMLSRLVPQDTADADQYECTYETKCSYRYPTCIAQAFRGKMRRQVCAGTNGPSYSSWQQVGCC
jgi:hypothetical protein